MRASLASFAAIGILVGVGACSEDESAKPDPPPAAAPATERLEELVPALVDAIQAKQPIFVLDHVAESFRASDGLDYFGVRALVDTNALRDEEVGARLDGVSITAQPDGRQRVVADVSFALGQRLAADGPLPPGAVTYALDLLFALDGARWQAISGSYRRK